MNLSKNIRDMTPAKENDSSLTDKIVGKNDTPIIAEKSINTAQNKLKSFAMKEVDYLKIQDQEYYISQFLPKGGLFMLVSDSGQGKSWLSFMLCRRVLEEELNTKIFFIDVDSGATYTKKRVEMLNDIGIDRFHYISQVKATSQDIIPLLKDMSREDLNDTIIVIDSLVGMSDGDVNSSEKIKPLLNIFEGLRNVGATVILIHHVKKSKDEEGKPIYAGSYTIKGAMDALYAITKKDKVIECHLDKSRGDYVSRTFEITDFQQVLAKDIDYKSPEEKKAEWVKKQVAKEDITLLEIMYLNEEGIKTKDLETLLVEKLGTTQKLMRSTIRRNKNHKIIEEIKGTKNTKWIVLKK